AQYVDSLTEKNTALREEFNEVCDLDEIRQLALALGMIPKLENSFKALKEGAASVVIRSSEDLTTESGTTLSLDE
ncbi:MAG: hypothetical protein II276_01995, partial [Bacteroidales bacterium]|nr:hypothetical protein [Bacteroidales bacterium]